MLILFLWGLSTRVVDHLWPIIFCSLLFSLLNTWTVLGPFWVHCWTLVYHWSSLYIYIYIYIVYICKYIWYIKCNPENSVQCALPVITTMALWQLMHLSMHFEHSLCLGSLMTTYIIYIYIYIYIHIYIYIFIFI